MKNNAIDGYNDVLVQIQNVSGGSGSTTGGTYVDVTGSSVSIKPKSANNLILVYASIPTSVGGGATTAYVRCLRDGATVIGTDPLGMVGNLLNAGNGWLFYAGGFVFVDSPATTSSITYKLQVKSIGVGALASCSAANINLIEIDPDGITTKNAINNVQSTKVKQIQYFNNAGSSTSSTAMVDITSASVTITPTNAANNIVVLAYLRNDIAAAGGNTSMYIQCLRDATVIGGTPYAVLGALDAAVGARTLCYNVYTYTDAPGVATLVTYKFQHKSVTGSSVTSNPVNIVLMEIEP